MSETVEPSWPLTDEHVERLRAFADATGLTENEFAMLLEIAADIGDDCFNRGASIEGT